MVCIETYAYRGDSEYAVLLQEVILLKVNSTWSLTENYMDKIVNKLLG